MKESITMSQQERKPHKHAEIIKAWADGETIQWRGNLGNDLTDWKDWLPDISPSWDSLVLFRVKPSPIPAGTALMRSWQTALKNCSAASDDLWQVAAEIFIEEIKNGKVKGF